MRSNPLRFSLVALGYAVVGWLSLQLAVPPGYAVPFFPAAGIALSARIIYGPRILPAVFLGSLAVQIPALLQSSVAVPVWWGPALVPLGAVLQAGAGAWLAERLIGFPNPLDAPRPIIRFLLGVAPLSCLVSPTFAIPVLMGAGVISFGDATFNWWNWWVGDTLGVVVATPLMFAFLGHPAADWRARRFGIAIPLGIAIVLLGFAFHQVRNWEALRVETQFSRDADHITSQVRKRLDMQLDMLQSIERLITVSENVNGNDFRDFVMPWIERYPGTQNFGWSPLVSHAQRDAFEAALRESDTPDFRIRDRQPDGRTFTAAEADEYLPIIFVEPFRTNRSVVGLNPLSLPATAEAIRETRQTGRPVTTEGVRLVQESGDQRGVIVYLAVFERQSDFTAERRLRGVISGVFRMDDAIAGALEGARSSGIELCLTDLDAPVGNRRLAGPVGCDSADWARGLPVSRSALQFAGRQWSLVQRAGPEYLGAIRSWAAWSSIAIGLVSVGILGAFLLITTGNTRRIAALIERRTTELASAGSKLRQQQAALAQAQRVARLGSWETDNELCEVRCSAELHRVLERPEGRLGTMEELMDAVIPLDRPALLGALEQVARAPDHATLDCRVQARPTRIVQFQIESEWQDGVLERIRGTVQDVTSAREAEAHIQYLAHYDSLTGLPNRSAWMNQARSALSLAQRHQHILAVLFLDLDNFKTVNDSLGHPVGDRLLAAVAQRLAHCLREEDSFARLGGDEFVALLPRVTRAEDAAAVARKMLDALATPVVIDDHELAPSVSIGISLFPSDGTDVDTLLKHADTAMYGAKEVGRNNFQFFVPEMNTRALERLLLENALRRAIERNELTLHYQPQVAATSDRPNGCEALVRWQHPDFGLVPPAQFIPIAEDSGLIVPLGEWVLREACRQQVKWARSGLHLMVGVNISALQFRRADFVDSVVQVLAETGANPERIELEITESALMDASDALSRRLRELANMGLSLALDDFGTGYSSLAYLKRLPIGRLKIDRSFVKDLPGDPEDAAVTAATLSLARDLGLEVVAEGVETVAQRDFLVARGCHTLQGYLYSRPLDVAAFEAWMQATEEA
ncbi:EAL domain-containing protein [Azoarcus olearius]|uniref:GGDEF/EAL-domain containing protein n=1 Tax=Azoarcus sp. (strain BH72) TaxID=418699 RepID=A1K5S9_AZOSB|nr:EAL domain-containing protein [Azoarcus olearius]ANQ84734.1 diguanylate cyclase [Azoarcus olearius]CAL94184.1 GGDEF/EAL-domain containing protein [Azoarcus olearius]